MSNTQTIVPEPEAKRQFSTLCTPIEADQAPLTPYSGLFDPQFMRRDAQWQELLSGLRERGKTTVTQAEELSTDFWRTMRFFDTPETA